jgi:hypothetical protein
MFILGAIDAAVFPKGLAEYVHAVAEFKSDVVAGYLPSK